MGDERAETYLRLVPPLAAAQDTIELLATGGSAQIRAVVPVRGAPAMPDN